MTWLLIALLVLVSWPLAAHARNRVLWALGWLLGLVALLLTTPARALHHHAIPVLDRRAADTFDHLGYRHPDNDHRVDGGPLWDLFGPIIYLGLFLLLLVGDLYIFGLRLAALLKLESVPAAVRLDALGAIVWAAMLASLGMVLLDLLGATAISRPWHNLSPRWRRVALIVVGGALAVSMLAAMLFFLWGQLMIDGRPVPLLGQLFMTAFGGVLQVAILVTGAALLASGLIVWFVVLSGLRLGARGLLLPLLLGVWLLDRLFGLLVALYDLLAFVGRGLWNWVVSFVGLRLHLEPIDWTQRPSLDRELYQPLPGPEGALLLETDN